MIRERVLSLVAGIIAAAAPLTQAGCLGAGTPDDAHEDADKNGGNVTTLREAVGVLTSSTKLCSGTLIAPDRVLTAAHCYDAANTFTVTTAKGTRMTRKVSLVVVHEAYVPGLATWENYTHDIMLVDLDVPITEIKPIRMDTFWPEVGDAVELVGYGVSAPGARDAGIKRLLEATVTGLGAWVISASGATATAGCSGDSGGAMLRWDGGVYLAGVISHGDEPCTFSNAVAVAAHAGWIEAAMSALDAEE